MARQLASEKWVKFVAAIIEGAPKKLSAIQVGSIKFVPKELGEVGGLVKAGKIKLYLTEGGDLCKYIATGKQANQMELLRSVLAGFKKKQHLEGLGTIVHEAVHALHDKQKLKVNSIEAEGLAYVVQMMYCKKAGLGSSGNAVFDAAVAVVNNMSARSAKSADLEKTLFDAVRGTGLYKDKAQVNDGIQ